MHAVIIGAGALGQTYGVHLASVGVRVSFLVRPERMSERSAFTLERLTGKPRPLTLQQPQRIARIPDDANVLLLAVRREQLNDALERTLQTAPSVPLVALTPVLPQSEAHLAGLIRGPCIVALPTVAARSNAGRTQFFVPPFAKTLIESELGQPEILQQLIDALNRAKLPAAWSRGVRRRNPATTIAFYPLTLGLSIAGSMDRFTADAELCSSTLTAVREALQLARRIGPVTPPLRLALRVANRFLLRVLVASARFVAGPVTELLEEHFATKLVAQHRVLGDEILELARQNGMSMPRLAALLGRAPCAPAPALQPAANAESARNAHD
ncbi:MAG TPA: 2-dehydropantoate 2-reductase N-terminal domain-containing protein [Polyangiaceae bacterium]|nr:2-dehydropantoate 2-reductase N-terminal domain-containing protein [Polyangiaceae bacterium]